MAENIDLGIVGIKNMGEYNSQTNYEKLNVVTYQGSTYCAKQPTQGNLPTNTDYWQLYAEKGEVGPQGPKPIKGTDYFTEEDITSIENDLKPTITSDVSDEVISQLGSLVSATPLVASSVSEMTDTTRIYVNTTDGHWYWYDGTDWQDGGIYQATGVSYEEISPDKINFRKELYYYNEQTVLWEIGNIIGSTGGNGIGNTAIRTPLASKIKVLKGSEISIYSDDYNMTIFKFEDSTTSSYYQNSGQITNGKYIINEDCYIRVMIRSLTDEVQTDTSASSTVTYMLLSSTAKDKLDSLDRLEDIKTAHLYLANNAGVNPNFDFYSKSLIFKGNTCILYNENKKVFQNLTVDLINVWNLVGIVGIFYNRTNESIKVLSANSNAPSGNKISTDLDLVNDFLILSFNFNSRYVNNQQIFNIEQVKGITNYTICNQQPEIYYSNKYKINSLIPQYWYTLLTNNPYHDISQMTYQDIYNGYDNLVTNYPNYVTKELLGMDESNTYPIYCYKFTPPTVKTESSGASGNWTITMAAKTKILPKGMITTGLHGSEKPSILALLNLMTLICNSWQTDEILQYIRFNVPLIIIPIVNPWGFVNNARGNSNHVDLNRNFNTPAWETNGSSDPTNDRYKGTAKASEKETQYVQSVIDNNTDLLFMYDIHSLGTNDTTYITKFETQQYVPLDNIMRVAEYVIKGVTLSGYKNHNMPDKNDYIGKIGIDAPVNATANCYASYQYRINAGAPEVMYSYTGRGGETSNTYDVERLNIEYIANIIIYTLNQFLNKIGW